MGLRMCYRPVLAALARVAMLSAGAARGCPRGACPSGARGWCPIASLALAADPDPGVAVSRLVHAVPARIGDAPLDFGRVLRRRWMGRKIAFEAVPV